MPQLPTAFGTAARAALVPLTGVVAVLLAVAGPVAAGGPASAYCDSIVAAAGAPPELAAPRDEVHPPVPDLAGEDLQSPVPEVGPALAANAAPIAVTAPWTEAGEASWYGPYFHGRRTASGEAFDATARSIAHPSLPFGAIVAIENAANGRTVLARVNDRGPFVPGRILDCSYRVAHDLGFVGEGVASVRVTWVDNGAAEDFAGTGKLVALCEADREPLARYAAAFPTGSRRSTSFIGPPEPPLELALAAAPEVTATEAVAVRRASVVSFSAVMHAGRHLLRALFGPYADAPLDLGLPARLDGFGLRTFVRLFV